MRSTIACLLRHALTVLSILICSSSASAVPDQYLGIYYNGKKVGWVHIASSPATYEGKSVTKTVSTTKVSMQLLGNTVSQDVSSTTLSDGASRPVYQEHRIVSNGSALNVKAVYHSTTIDCTVSSGGGPTKTVIPIPAGAKLMGDSTVNRVEGLRKPGDKASLLSLNPLTVVLDKIDMEIEAEETVKLNGQDIPALRSVATTPFGKLRSWESVTGSQMLKGEMPIGMAMYGEPKDRALDMTSKAPEFSVIGAVAKPASEIGYNPSDIGMSTSIKVEPPIDAPRKLAKLVLNVGGAELANLPPNDARQRSEETGSGRHIEITAKTFDAKKSAKLPISNSGVSIYQRSAAYLEIGDPIIKAKAAELKGKETNAYVVAMRINSWIHQQMKPDYSIGVPRSCKDVLQRKKGVCRDYATLFAGLARAAGIPTRVAGGIVYADGRFYYHAWVECWVGEWVPFDATMGGEFVDATHVKLAQGEVTEMYQSANVIGRLQVKVLQSK